MHIFKLFLCLLPLDYKAQKGRVFFFSCCCCFVLSLSRFLHFLFSDVTPASRTDLAHNRQGFPSPIWKRYLVLPSLSHLKLFLKNCKMNHKYRKAHKYHLTSYFKVSALIKVTQFTKQNFAGHSKGPSTSPAPAIILSPIPLITSHFFIVLSSTLDTAV